MARRMAALTKAASARLAIGGILAGIALVVGISLSRGRDLEPSVPPARAKTETRPAKPTALPIERSRAQALPIDPHALVVRSVLPVAKPFRHGDYVWDDSRAPATGPVIITVDLKAQTLSAFRAGHEIGAAVIIYGADDKPSPLGAFPITEKDADHFSSTYGGAPMPFMLRLTNDGVAIHGSDVKWGNATHGCIGVPKAFARKLFGVTQLGDLVIITRGKMLDVSRAKGAA